VGRCATEVERRAGWRSTEVERRAAGWSAAPVGGGRAAAGRRVTEWSAVGWMEQEHLSASVSILALLVIGRPDGEEVEADPVVEVEVDPTVRR
jgi:hypothetical protein